ncbi:MAG: PEP-CTERM sorting domain-containing protein, partial [Acetobacteraceae bacterium]|nr:PEP-CTERM sorting domain-containing protein [Acetobacteraceae bacterium]
FGLFQSLSGNVLIQGFCGPATELGPLSLSFSANLTGIALNFATVGGPSTVTLAAFENTTAVGSVNFTSAVPTGLFNGEGLARFAGTFNRLTLTGNTLLAMDNVNAQTTAPVPEPAAFGTILAGMGLFAAFARRQKRERGNGPRFSTSTFRKH